METAFGELLPAGAGDGVYLGDIMLNQVGLEDLCGKIVKQRTFSKIARSSSSEMKFGM